MKYREIISYKDYFEDFFNAQEPKVQKKIIKILDIVEHIERIPQTYLKSIEGTNGLFEIRIQLSNNIFRIFCFFDGKRLVVLLSVSKRRHKKHLRTKLIVPSE